MASVSAWLDVPLIGLLAATLLHALRLERALGVLRRDRESLARLVEGFNASTRQAEDGIERLRFAAENAGQRIARDVDAATTLRSDLALLTERGERVADRLDVGIRAARPGTGATAGRGGERGRSKAERDLMRALSRDKAADGAARSPEGPAITRTPAAGTTRGRPRARGASAPIPAPKRMAAAESVPNETILARIASVEAVEVSA